MPAPPWSPAAGMPLPTNAAPHALLALPASVTAPLRARALPATLAPVFVVMVVRATMLPSNDVVVPSVAELPTCQDTPQADPPLMTFTIEPEAVVSVLPILKTKAAAGLPCALSVSVPVSWAELLKQ